MVEDSAISEFIISDAYDGFTRKLFKVCCSFCDKDSWKPQSKIRKTNFCSVTCQLSSRTGTQVNCTCSYCNKSFLRLASQLRKKKSKEIYCSRTCQSAAHRKYSLYCIICNKQKSNPKNNTCSKKCSSIAQYNKHIEQWQAGQISGINVAEATRTFIKKFLISKFGNKCQLCGWAEINPKTMKVPIQVDHINGDYTDNKEENLRLLCPNCHSLTPTYGALNKGKGRKLRREKLRGISSIGRASALQVEG